jgi:hypothetical protein
MDFANMHRLIAHCLNDSCRHQAIVEAPAETKMPLLRFRLGLPRFS